MKIIGNRKNFTDTRDQGKKLRVEVRFDIELHHQIEVEDIEVLHLPTGELKKLN